MKKCLETLFYVLFGIGNEVERLCVDCRLNSDGHVFGWSDDDVLLIDEGRVGTVRQVTLHCAAQSERGYGLSVFGVGHYVDRGPTNFLATRSVTVRQAPRFSHFTRCFQSQPFKIVRRYGPLTMTDLRRSNCEHLLVCGGIRPTSSGNRIDDRVDSSHSRDHRIDVSGFYIPCRSTTGLISKRNDVVAPRRRNAAVYSVAEFNFARMSIQAVMSAVGIGIKELHHLGPLDPDCENVARLIGDRQHRIFSFRQQQLFSLFICQRFLYAHFLTLDYGSLLKME